MFYQEPMRWYAQRSFERPRTMLAVVFTVILLLAGGGLPLFKQSEDSDYDWLIGGALHVTNDVGHGRWWSQMMSVTNDDVMSA
jgi:hypothetical protein